MSNLITEGLLIDNCESCYFCHFFLEMKKGHKPEYKI